jgi:hypothetical protein
MTNHPPIEIADDPADFPDDTPAESVDKLIEQGTQMVAGLRDLRIAVDRQRRVQFWAIVVGAALILMLGFVGFDNRDQIQQLKHQFCPMIVGIIPAPGEPQPPVGKDGDRGRSVIGTFKGLAQDFGCQLRR